MQPDIPYAHPLDGRPAALARSSVEETAARLGVDGPAYRRLMDPFVEHGQDIIDYFSPARSGGHPPTASLR